MPNSNLPKPGEPGYPTDPILIAAIEAERERQQQIVSTSKNATAAKKNLETFNQGRAQQFSDLAAYTASHDTGGHGLSGIVASAGRILNTIDKDSSAHSFYVNAEKWQTKTEDAATAYAKNPNNKNLKAFNDAKAEFSRYADQYVKSAKDTRSADEIWGTDSVGAKLSPAAEVTNKPSSYQTAGQYAQLQGQEIIKPLTIAKGKKTVDVNIHQDANGKFIKATDPATGKEISVKADKNGNLSVASTPRKTSVAGSAGGTTGGNTYITYNTGGGNQAPAVAPKKKTAAELMLDYGVQTAVIKSDKSLNDLFDKAVKTQMSVAAFQAELKNTDFYLNHAPNWSTARTIQLGDPARWKQELKDAANFIQKEATATGMNVTPAEVESLAKAGLFSSGGTAGAITTDWLDTHLVNYGQITGKSGTTLDTINSLKNTGEQYGIKHDDKWYSDAAKSVLAKTQPQNFYEQTIKDLAKSKYANFAEQIDAGQTVKSLASPYVNSMSTILELPAGSINLNDPTINKALTNVDPATNKPALKPTWEFEQELRKDNRYFQTSQAHQQFADLASGIANMFGKI